MYLVGPGIGIAKLPRASLGPYLAGLIEGDGNINVPKVDRSSNGSLNYPRISIAFAIADLPLALMIQSYVGGYIQFRSGTSCHLHVKGKNLFFLIHLINGYMRTPKIEALYRMII